MAFGTIKRETLEMQVYQELRAAIIGGTLAGGARLIQDILATQFGTSRIPVRDALKRLEKDGLVRLDERGSYTVQALSREDVTEVYALRSLLEPYAAQQASAQLNAPDIDELAGIVTAMQQAIDDGDIDRYVELNEAFHSTLYEHSGQRRTVTIIHSLWSGVLPLTPMAVPGQLARSMAEHHAIIDALRQRQHTQVADLMRAHIAHAATSLLAHMSSQEHADAQ